MEHDQDASASPSMLMDEYYDDPSLLSQLLRQRAGPAVTTLSHDSSHPESAVSSASPRREIPESIPDVRIPASASPPAATKFTARRDRTGPHHVPPRLEKSTTAPIPTSTALLRATAAKMAQSFAGPFDAPGDTQPDSQFYSHYTNEVQSNINVTGNVNPAGETAVGSPSGSPTDSAGNVSSQRQEQQSCPTSPTVLNVEDDSLRALETQSILEPTSPFKFQTPAMPSRKRNSQGQRASSEMKTVSTPGTNLASAFFGAGIAPAGGPTMSLTQIFNTTQAGTSPLVNALPSDPVFQRPSPNFASRSSPPPTTSSPIKNLPDGRLRATSEEPRDEYVTMKESQKLREQELQDEGNQDEQDSWNEPTEAELRAARRRAKEKLEQEARKSYMNVTAQVPVNIVSRSSMRKKPFFLSSSPKDETPVALRASRHMSSLDGKNDVSNQGPQDAGDEEPNLIHIDDSEEDISPPSSAMGSKVSPTNGPSSSHKRVNKVQVPNTSSHPDRTLSGRSPPKLTPSSPKFRRQHEPELFQARISHGPERPLGPMVTSTMTEIVTIADSQPDIAPEPESLPISASPANRFGIPQTRHENTGLTSQVTSSSVPPPPRTSSPILGESRVPSSPPAINEEDEEDIVMDEHSGGEEDGGDEVMLVAGSDCEQVDMGGEHRFKEGGEEEQLPDADQEDLDVNYDSDIGMSQPSPGKIREIAETQQGPSATTQPDHASGTRATETHATNNVSEIAESTAPVEAHSTEQFDTARSHYSVSPRKNASSQGSRRGDSDGAAPTRIRTLTDIANDTGTQRSVTDVNDIELSDLGFGGEDFSEIDKILSGSSPVNPIAKRRRIVYSKKRTLASDTRLKTTIGNTMEGSPPSLSQRQPGFAEPRPPPRSLPEEEDAGEASDSALFTKPATLRLNRPPRDLLSKSKTDSANTRKTERRYFSEIAETPAKPQEPSSPAEDNMVPDDENQSPQQNAGGVDDAGSGPPVGGFSATPEPAGPVQTEPPKDDMVESPNGELANPNRVFARWPNNLGFYPATCIASDGHDNYSVRFDDGNVSVMEPHHVRSLDLQSGDMVKVDIQGLKKNTYVVVGLKDKLVRGPETDDYPATDRHGYRTVVLEVKQRESLPKSKDEESPPRISVSVTFLYLTKGLWNRFHDRQFTYTPTPSAIITDGFPMAPSAVITPARTDVRTPVGRGSLRRESVPRAASVASSVRPGLFSNMAFALTFTKETSDKDAIVELLLSNGATVLEDGFHVLFQDAAGTSFGNDGVATPKSVKAKARTSPKITESRGEYLRLKPRYRDLGFVGLITDSHCRRTKYIQALALNIPCLHYRWAIDCTRTNNLLPFLKYLLPAGLSTFFDPSAPVVRSRTIIPYNPAGVEAKFETVVGSRERLLDGQNVLLVMGKKKSEVERKQPYLFLTHALGPKTVGQCADLDSAKEMVTSGDWDWVYVDRASEKGIDHAATVLFDATGKRSGTIASFGKNKKRKREEMDDSDIFRVGKAGGKTVRVVCDEFVVQSLILGALAED